MRACIVRASTASLALTEGRDCALQMKLIRVHVSTFLFVL